jgi:flagellar hook protein FlgE
MSLFGALTTGVSGINAQSRAIGNISDNLANTQTVGYKRVDTSFETLVTSSNARNHTPGGVIASPVFRNALQGTLIGTQSATDIAITGNGFFAAAPSSTAAETVYTRRGDFQLDRNGFLVNGSGQFLRGWAVTDSTTTPPTVDNSAATQIRVDPAPVPAAQTTQVDYRAQLPSNAAVGASFTSTVQTFDQFGNVNQITLRWQRLAGANQWGLSIGLTDENGTRTNIAGQAFPTVTPAIAAVGAVDGSANTFTFNDGTGGAAAPAGTLATPAADITLTTPYGAGSANVVLGFGTRNSTAGMTQFSDPQAQLSVRTITPNGNASGQFRDLSISEEGFVSANYSNGQQRTLFQIPLANFPAPQALQRLDGGGFSQTLDSGTPTLNAAGRGGTGNLTASAVEGSNVDIADEFSKLIVTQRVFSANARVITTSDELLNEVVNLKR